MVVIGKSLKQDGRGYPWVTTSNLQVPWKMVVCAILLLEVCIVGSYCVTDRV